MGRKTNSMYTVCGQAQPHQTRPKSAVARKMPMTPLTARSISSSVSVGRNVVPKNVNSPPLQVEQDGRLAVEEDVRDGEVDDDEHPRDRGAPVDPCAGCGLRANPAAGAVFIEGREDPARCRRCYGRHGTRVGARGLE